MVRFFSFVAAISLACLSTAAAQKPHPALQSQEAFFAEIQGKKWETSFTSYPRIRFEKDRIDFVGDDGKVTGRMINVSYPEPGQVRVEFRDKSFHLFVFSDDLETFVICNMLEANPFTLEAGAGAGAAALPVAATDAPLTISFVDNPFWKAGRLHADKMELLDGSGAVFATHPAFAYSSRVQGVALQEKQAGAVVLSRQKPGTGWYLKGRNLGTGLRTDVVGPFRMFLRTHLSKFQLRSAHFIYPLLLAGKDQLAAGQERYAVKLNKDGYGDSSDKVARCLQEMGKLRGYARSYAGAAALLAESLAHAKTSLATDKSALLDISTDLASSQNDAGDFAGAKKTLAEAHALLPAPGGDIGGFYFFYDALGAAEFGLRNYSQAAKVFADNLKRVQDAGYKSNIVTTLLNLIPCHLAQGQAAQAETALRQCMETQDQWQKENPNHKFDNWKLAFACVALGKNQEAVKYSPVYSQRRSWVSYEEYGRMVSLYNSGDKAGAQTLAKQFVERFSNINEINIRDDMDPITVALTLAIANQTPDAITALEQVWAAQVDSLRNRPLKNYVFAKVMVLTLAKLKGR